METPVMLDTWPPPGIDWAYYDDYTALACGDCRNVLPKLQGVPIDLVLTDPPYGVGMSKGFEGFGGFGKKIARRQYRDNWDSSRPTQEVFALLLQRSKHAIIWGGQCFADFLPQGKHWLVWDKLNTMPSFGDCELAWTNFPRFSVKKIRVEYNGLLGKEAERQHPTQKPLALFRWIISEYSKPGEILCDPFAGSGTTLVAAKDLGRRCIGVEIEPKYVDITIKRLRQEVLPFPFRGA